MPCNLEAILPLAGTHGVKVIEDAACAIGSEILWEDRWERIGKPHADVACFSFHPRKVITTGDGGMLTTDSEEMDQRFRLWRQHGMQVTDAVRHSSTEVIFEDYPCIGYNYRMTDLQAAVGRVQLKRLPGIIQRRRELAAHYTEVLAGVEGIILPGEPSWARSNWQTYLITLADEFSQRGVMQCLLDHGVSTRRGIMCAHREGAYADCPKPHPLPHSENAQDRTVAIPLFPQMTEEDQDYVVRCLRDALKSDCVRV
jgi:dTDP-4-amino-4,6-dideoxygalactose transaminase